MLIGLLFDTWQKRTVRQLAMMAPLRVMVSGTAQDLPEHRREVFDACLQMGLLPTTVESTTAEGRQVLEQCLPMVDAADLDIAIIGFRYGYVPFGSTRSLTELEYQQASERGIPRLVFLMDESHPVRHSDVDTGDAAIRVKEFRERLQSEHMVGFFRSPEDLLESAWPASAIRFDRNRERGDSIAGALEAHQAAGGDDVLFASGQRGSIETVSSNLGRSWISETKWTSLRLSSTMKKCQSSNGASATICLSC